MNSKFCLRNYSGTPTAYFLTENVAIPISKVKPQPSHHIMVVDRSGSMCYDMAELRTTLEKVLTLDEFKNPNLQVSLISYSSQSDVTLHFSKVFVEDVVKAGSKYVSQIRGIQATALTCISQGLALAETLIDDKQITCVSLHSDGYANDRSPYAEKSAVADVIAKLQKHPNVFVNTVAYRESSDFQFLSSISNQLSGTCFQAKNIKQVWEALYSTMEGLARGGSPTIEIPIGSANYVVFTSKTDKKVIGGSSTLAVRGVTADEGCQAYRFYEVSQKEWDDSMAPVAENTDLSRFAFIRYAIADGRLNQAKFAMIDTRAANYIARNYRALSNKDLAAFASDTENKLFGLEAEYWSPIYGLTFGSKTTVLEVMDLLRRNRDSIRVNVTDLKSKYTRRGLKRVAGVRNEDGTLTEPRLTAIARKSDDYANPSSIEVNRTSASVNMTFALPTDLVDKSSGEILKEIAGIPLDLKDYRAYTVVADGVVNVPTLTVKFSSKKAWDESLKLGLVTGEFSPGSPVVLDLKSLPIVGDSLSELVHGGVVESILELTVQQKLFSAMLKGISEGYSDEQVAELKKHYLSPNLYLNFPTTNAYTDLKEALSKGEVDSNISYTIDVGTNYILNTSKFKSGNAFFQANYKLSIAGVEVEKPTLDMIWIDQVKVEPKPTKTKVSPADQLMGREFSHFFTLVYDRLSCQSEAQEILNKITLQLEDCWSQVSPLVFYIASTGLFPEGVAVMDAEALQAKYPDLAISKNEKEGRFFELPGKGVVSVFAESNYYTVERS